MEQEKHFRHELKYAITYSDYLIMRQKLKLIMKSDPHVNPDTGQYLIRSIYFDNSEDKALKEKMNGIAKREKFRIRYYNDDMSFITLEKKMKIDHLCLKYDAAISEQELRELLAGNTAWMKEHPSDLVRELYAKMNYQRLFPKVLVSYVREPYIYSAGNVRVTFDSQIRTSLFSNAFLTDQIPDISATGMPAEMLMEVKYDAFLPEIIQRIVQLPGGQQQSFSKYEACRRFG